VRRERAAALAAVGLPLEQLGDLARVAGFDQRLPQQLVGVRVAPRAHRGCGAIDVRRCFAPHHLRHAHAVEMARDGVPLIVIQRQRAARMDRVDDLGVVDALEVDGGDAEVGVAAPMVPVDSSLPL
jgi:hypothetical protein